MSKPGESDARQVQASLAGALVRFVLASYLLSALSVSAIAVHSIHTTVQASLQREHRAAIERVAAAHAALLERGREELAGIAAEPRAWRRGSSARERLDEALRVSGHFESLAWLGSDGALRGGAGPDASRLAALAPEPGLQAGGAGGLAAWVVRLERGSGLLAGAIRPDVLAEPLGLEAKRLGGALSVAAADGTRLLSSREVAEQTPLALADLLESGPGVPRTLRDPAGRLALATAAPRGPLGWHLVVEVPWQNAFAPLGVAAALILALDLLALLGVLRLTSRFTGALVVPIRRLAERARRIASGQLVELPAPARDDEIGLLTRSFNDMVRTLRRDRIEIERVNRSLRNSNQDLRQVNEVLSQLSITDGLTKLHNHRFFQDHLSREIKRVNRSGEPLAMILVDIDDFKKLNDRLGHAAGDEVLVGIARIMETTIRDCDLLARYGGEEFVVLASGTDRLGAYQLAEKIRMAVSDASFILGDSLRPTRVSVSIGVAQFSDNRRTFFDAADRALYEAKGQGKNCVVLDEELAPPDPR